MADDKIPKGRIRRSVKLGSAVGTQATRYAGTKAANVARSEEAADTRLEARHLETAVKMASVLGEMKGAAMKMGQLASFIDTPSSTRSSSPTCAAPRRRCPGRR
jgi:predicted unusual protein kinase regulating ubiquinone biosynthesis (AarF/ABC1/UbiB family)